MAETAYGIEKEPLEGILREAKDGRIKLPDFQRGWVWDDDRIRSLLASISLSYPIGAVLMLETGGESIHFNHRRLEGAADQAKETQRLILDGQQRLTSLLQSLRADKPVTTQDAKGRWYYINIEMALDPHTDRKDAIISVPEDRKVRTFRKEVVRDYSTPGREYEEMVFPLQSVFDAADWRVAFEKHWDYDKEKIKLWNDFDRSVIRAFEQYQIPVIELGNETPREAVCQVFEKVNTGGITLTVFELLTATFAADNFELRRDWCERSKRLAVQSVLRGVSSTAFLQVITLLATQERRRKALAATPGMDRPPAIGVRRTDMLRLTLEEYHRWSDPVEEGLLSAARFLHSQHIFSDKFLPYGTQLIPLSAILVELGKDWESHHAKDKLAQWYWCGVFGELYGGTTETRIGNDLPEVVEWIRDEGPAPRTVTDAHFAQERILSLRTRASAAYKGVYTLLLQEEALDLRTGEGITALTYFDKSVDIHHVFPQKWCKARRIDPKRCDAIVNKTPLSATTNRQIGGRDPSGYLTRIEGIEGITPDELDGYLRSHLIDPEALRSDDFDRFFEARRVALLDKISSAMGKPIETVIADDGVDTGPADYEVIGEEGLEEVGVGEG